MTRKTPGALARSARPTPDRHAPAQPIPAPAPSLPAVPGDHEAGAMLRQAITLGLALDDHAPSLDRRFALSLVRACPEVHEDDALTIAALVSRDATAVLRRDSGTTGQRETPTLASPGLHPITALTAELTATLARVQSRMRARPTFLS